MPDEPVRVVIGSDTCNEVDDQFAIACTLLSDERMRVEAVYAAPPPGPWTHASLPGRLPGRNDAMPVDSGAR